MKRLRIAANRNTKDANLSGKYLLMEVDVSFAAAKKWLKYGVFRDLPVAPIANIRIDSHFALRVQSEANRFFIDVQDLTKL
ncbi:hypothetical protein [Rosistilla ulvae]|uniref:hypothetical protein n=1 Tax=Rosistilla ulvae TaxID=1930277 RepID=UPI0011A23DB6|nr:hypothetical protein [Rosistilla ulvae]